MSRTKVRASLDSMQLTDIYSLMLFALYKTQDLPEYAVLSELCYLLDSHGLTRLLTYFAGKTVTFPTEEEFVTLVNALLLYQHINIENQSLANSIVQIDGTQKEKDAAVEMYVKLVPIMKQYNIDRGQIQTNG